MKASINYLLLPYTCTFFFAFSVYLNYVNIYRKIIQSQTNIKFFTYCNSSIHTCKHSWGSVLLTDQCIQVRPFASRSMPSASSTWKLSELLSNSKCLMWSSRHAHIHGVRPSLSRTFTSALCWIRYWKKKMNPNNGQANYITWITA